MQSSTFQYIIKLTFLHGCKERIHFLYFLFGISNFDYNSISIKMQTMERTIGNPH